jgi:hypothetical protein
MVIIPMEGIKIENGREGRKRRFLGCGRALPIFCNGLPVIGK